MALTGISAHNEWQPLSGRKQKLARRYQPVPADGFTHWNRIAALVYNRAA